MIAKLVLGVCLLALAGCFEAEAVLKVNSDKSVSGTADLSISRALHEFGERTGNKSVDMCREGALSVTAAGADCRFGEHVLLSARDVERGSQLDFMTVEERSDEIIRITVPVRALWVRLRKERPLSITERNALEAARPVMQVALDDRKIEIVIEGYRIMKTNGEISEDKTRATLAIPSLDLIEDRANLPETFYADVRYEPCKVAFFCR